MLPPRPRPSTRSLIFFRSTVSLDHPVFLGTCLRLAPFAMAPAVFAAVGRRTVAAVATARQAAATATFIVNAAVRSPGTFLPVSRGVAAPSRGVAIRGLSEKVVRGHAHASVSSAGVSRGSIGGVGDGSGGGGGGSAASVSGEFSRPHYVSAPPSPPQPARPRPASLDPAEVVKFNAQAANWWDPDGGPSAALHALNPLRIAYIRAAAEMYGRAGRGEGDAAPAATSAAAVTTVPRHPAGLAAAAAAGAAVATATPSYPAGPPASAATGASVTGTAVPARHLTGTPPPSTHVPPPPLRPLAGIAALDVGCAGGLVAEPLARLGASVYGIDVSPAGVAVAAAHAVAVDGPAALSASRLSYKVAGVEGLGDGVTYDLVTCMEVVEHVAAPRNFLAALASRVAPGGVLVLSTLNRTAAAWVLGVVAAERVLGWVPPGTHEWGRFVAPGEVVAALAEVAPALEVVDVCGLSYRPLSRRFELSDDVSINYMLTAVRPADGPKHGTHMRG